MISRWTKKIQKKKRESDYHSSEKNYASKRNKYEIKKSSYGLQCVTEENTPETRHMEWLVFSSSI